MNIGYASWIVICVAQEPCMCTPYYSSLFVTWNDIAKSSAWYLYVYYATNEDTCPDGFDTSSGLGVCYLKKSDQQNYDEALLDCGNLGAAIMTDDLIGLIK